MKLVRLLRLMFIQIKLSRLDDLVYKIQWVMIVDSHSFLIFCCQIWTFGFTLHCISTLVKWCFLVCLASSLLWLEALWLHHIFFPIMHCSLTKIKVSLYTFLMLDTRFCYFSLPMLFVMLVCLYCFSVKVRVKVCSSENNII